MKTYRSSSFAFEFTGTRADAIKACTEFLRNLDSVKAKAFCGRFTWRASDDSGFTLVVGSIHYNVSLSLKWNASRNS